MMYDLVIIGSGAAGLSAGMYAGRYRTRALVIGKEFGGETAKAATTGAELNQKSVQIQNYPSELLRLKLVGVGKILTGILTSLLAIVFLLFMMPIRLAKLMKGNEQS